MSIAYVILWLSQQIHMTVRQPHRGDKAGGEALSRLRGGGGQEVSWPSLGGVLGVPHAPRTAKCRPSGRDSYRWAGSPSPHRASPSPCDPRPSPGTGPAVQPPRGRGPGNAVGTAGAAFRLPHPRPAWPVPAGPGGGAPPRPRMQALARRQQHRRVLHQTRRSAAVPARSFAGWPREQWARRRSARCCGQALDCCGPSARRPR